jgi:hypothetical protein
MLVGAVLTVGSFANAQDPGAGGCGGIEDEPAASDEAGGSDGSSDLFGEGFDDGPVTELEALDSDIEKLSGTQKLERARKKIRYMRGVLQETQALLKKTREEEPDIIKLTCINEKLAAIKGFVKVSEQSYQHLEDALSPADVEAQRHHYTLISIAAQKVKTLGEEARVCVGEVLRYSKDSTLVVTIDEDVADPEFILADDDAYDFEYAVERLPELTPYQ